MQNETLVAPHAVFIAKISFHYMPHKKHIGEYTKKEAIALALKYGSPNGFQRHAYNAYITARDNGWYPEIKKLISQRQSMTKEECHGIALKYHTPKEWERADPRSYSYAKNHKWISDITSHMNRIVDYTDNSVAEIALNYETRTEFARGTPGAWNYARTHGILDKVCAHMVIRSSKRERIIYVFEFDDHHAYVGLTFNIKDRLNCHLTNTKSAVYRHIHKTGCNYLFKTISGWLSEKDAQNEEQRMIDKYEADGWTMINSMHGGGLGACRKKYTLEYCKQVASGYHYKKHFMENHPTIYQTVHQNGWQKEVFAHMEKWTKCKERYPDEKIREILADCKIREDIKRLHNPLYQYLLKNKLLDKYMPSSSNLSQQRHPQGYWTLDRAIEVAPMCYSRTELRKRYYQAYILLKDNGLLDEYLPDIKGKRPKK